uniref:Uncharacterized protein n=1 Tax=Arundo donax TaxID=35708 RepID=A0A0A8ZUM4_ARUDO
MAKLERLELYFNEHGAAPAGIEHLSGLKEIFVDIADGYAKESNIRAAESALRDAIDMHPSSPIDNVEITGGQFVFDDMDDDPDDEEDEPDEFRYMYDEPDEEDGDCGSSSSS